VQLLTICLRRHAMDGGISRHRTGYPSVATAGTSEPLTFARPGEDTSSKSTLSGRAPSGGDTSGARGGGRGNCAVSSRVIQFSYDDNQHGGT
jgi:hypothetical protein